MAVSVCSERTHVIMRALVTLPCSVLGESRARARFTRATRCLLLVDLNYIIRIMQCQERFLRDLGLGLGPVLRSVAK